MSVDLYDEVVFYYELFGVYLVSLHAVLGCRSLQGKKVSKNMIHKVLYYQLDIKPVVTTG